MTSPETSPGSLSLAETLTNQQDVTSDWKYILRTWACYGSTWENWWFGTHVWLWWCNNH